MKKTLALIFTVIMAIALCLSSAAFELEAAESENEVVTGEEAVLSEEDFLGGRFALIRRGKRALAAVESR